MAAMVWDEYAYLVHIFSCQVGTLSTIDIVTVGNMMWNIPYDGSNVWQFSDKWEVRFKHFQPETFPGRQEIFLNLTHLGGI